jgi:hypothetical protein
MYIVRGGNQLHRTDCQQYAKSFLFLPTNTVRYEYNNTGKRKAAIKLCIFAFVHARLVTELSGCNEIALR